MFPTFVSSSLSNTRDRLECGDDGGCNGGVGTRVIRLPCSAVGWDMSDSFNAQRVRLGFSETYVDETEYCDGSSKLAELEEGICRRIPDHFSIHQYLEL